jgi:hypothetical protein
MKIELNTKEKTIKVLNETSFRELEQFLKNLEDYKDYKIISEIKYEYWPTTITSGTTTPTYFYGSSGNVTTKIPTNVTYTTSN